MSVLPDDLWRRIIETGVISSSITGNAGLSYKDLCCLSITCRRLHKISDDDSFWSNLFSSDYSTQEITPSSSNSSPNNFKTLYKIRYEKDRERTKLTLRRASLRIESEIAEHKRKIEEMEYKYVEESEKMKKSVAELMNLHRVKEASVALKVWQPEIVRGKQNHLVEQYDVPVDSRIRTLEMELRLCKQQIAGFEMAIKVEKRRLGVAKERLASYQYHPLHSLQDLNMKRDRIDGVAVRRKKKRNKYDNCTYI